MISFGSHGWLHTIQFAQNNSVKVTLGGSDCSNWIEGNLRHNVGTGWSVTHVQTSELVEDKTDSFVKLWKGHANTVCSKATREKKITLQPQYPIFFQGKSMTVFFLLLVANKFDQIGRAHQIGLCFLNYPINLRPISSPGGLWSMHFSDCTPVDTCVYVSVCCTLSWQGREKKNLISLRQCFSNLSQAEVWRIKVHWFLQPPGHRLKCELTPLLEVFLSTDPTSTPYHHPIHPLARNADFPSAVYKGIMFWGCLSLCM